MTPGLKEFIKENKQLIEDNKWFEFFFQTIVSLEITEKLLKLTLQNLCICFKLLILLLMSLYFNALSTTKQLYYKIDL